MPRLKITKRQEWEGLSFDEICNHDDICTDILVDQTHLGATVPKTRSRYTTRRASPTEDILTVIRRDVVTDNNFEQAANSVLGLRAVKQYTDRLHTESEKRRLFQHVKLYLHSFSTDCAWEISTTNRYTISVAEAAITARRVIGPNYVIPFLEGVRVSLSEHESELVRRAQCDFSITVSSMTGQASVMLGPARLVNHDCNPNAVLLPTSTGVNIKSLRQIECGEEITVFYSVAYFGVDNCDCLCGTCEQLGRNGWSQGHDTQPPATLSATKDYYDNERRKGDYLNVRSSLAISRRSKTLTRTPGDWFLTDRTFAHTYDRWVQCQNIVCNVNFQQENGYQTQRECQRCRRHRIIYSERWPLLTTHLAKTTTTSLISNLSAETLNTRFIPAGQERKLTRRGRLMEAKLARLRGHSIDPRFKTGKSAAQDRQLRRSRRTRLWQGNSPLND